MSPDFTNKKSARGDSPQAGYLTENPAFSTAGYRSLKPQHNSVFSFGKKHYNNKRRINTRIKE